MKRGILMIVVLVFITLDALAQKSFQITHGPYLCDMGENGVTIVWTTNKPALSWVEIAPDDDSNFYSYERQKYFNTKFGKARVDSLHSVRIEGLKAGTTYRYRIFSREVLNWRRNGDLISYGQTVAGDVFRKKPLKFTTYDSSVDTVSFLVLNDIHGRNNVMRELCKDINFKSLNMVIFNGDMSSYVNYGEQIFDDFIDTSVDLFASEIPIEFNRGNHEARGPFSNHLMDYFPRKDGKFYQLVNIGPASVLFLDCGEDKPDTDIEYSGLAFYDKYREKEASWLKEAVESATFKRSQIQIAILHIPPTVGNWHGNIHLNETLIPILNQAGVDLMLSGHTHLYSFHKAEESDAAFPVVVNSNNTALLCHVVKDWIRITVIGAGDKKTYDYWLEGNKLIDKKNIQ